MNDGNDGQMIFGDIGGLKRPDICLTGEEKPRKNFTQETCPNRDRTRARRVTGAHATTWPTAVYDSFLKNYFNWLLIYSRFDCEVLSRLSLFFCLGMVLFSWYIEPQQSHMWFFLIHGRRLLGHIQSSLRATSDVNNHEFRLPQLSWETSIGPCHE